jgi:hypothetical protein
MIPKKDIPQLPSPTRKEKETKKAKAEKDSKHTAELAEALTAVPEKELRQVLAHVCREGSDRNQDVGLGTEIGDFEE